MPNWETDAGLYTDAENEKREEEFNTELHDSDNYLDSIKELLNTREHVKRKKRKKIK